MYSCDRSAPGRNDFERGRTATFYLRVPENFQAAAIREIDIRKSPDGFAGGWKLGGVRV